MPACPRCEASVAEEARYCAQCGAPQTEEAAAELDEYVARQAEQGTGTGDGGSGLVSTEQLTDREQLWRRGCYVLGYGTVVVALTLVPQLGAFPLVLAGIVILPPIRRLTAGPLGSPLKREVMAGLYAIFAAVGAALLVV
mgnify:CR=1 FL=1